MNCMTSTRLQECYILLQLILLLPILLLLLLVRLLKHWMFHPPGCQAEEGRYFLTAPIGYWGYTAVL